MAFKRAQTIQKPVQKLNGWTVDTGIWLPDHVNTGSTIVQFLNVSGIWMSYIQISTVLGIE
jgi:hypothetical protein